MNKEEAIREIEESFHRKFDLKKIIAGRRILIWGACERSKSVVRLINEMELNVIGGGTSILMIK